MILLKISTLFLTQAIAITYIANKNHCKELKYHHCFLAYHTMKTFFALMVLVLAVNLVNAGYELEDPEDPRLVASSMEKSGLARDDLDLELKTSMVIC